MAMASKIRADRMSCYRLKVAIFTNACQRHSCFNFSRYSHPLLPCSLRTGFFAFSKCLRAFVMSGFGIGFAGLSSFFSFLLQTN